MTFFSTGTPTGTTYPCHAGSYNPKQGLTAWEQCIDCDAGNYCPQGSAAVTPCLA